MYILSRCFHIGQYENTQMKKIGCSPEERCKNLKQIYDETKKVNFFFLPFFI